MPAPRTRFERLYAAAGRRAGDQLADELLRAGTLEPTLTPSRLAAYAIASLVHLVTLASLGLGLWFAVSTFPNPGGILIGVLFASPGLLMAPRFGRLPKGAVATRREEMPELHAFCDDIAAALAVKPPHLIVVDDEFNASWSNIGWRRRRVLTLGLPLFTVLEPEERTALVAHELAHAKNGDASRGFVIGGALNALIQVHALLRPYRNPSGADALINWFFALLARPVWWVIHLEFFLLRRDSQRAEYLADALAAEVAGSGAIVSLHEKLLLYPTFWSVVQHAARAPAEEDMFERMQMVLRSVSARERERRRRVARLEESRLGDSHPPTAKRIRLVEERARREARVTMTSEVTEAIDRELEPLRPRAQEALIDAYRASVYR
jgi:Zn-dependent protease with chaperone function